MNWDIHIRFIIELQIIRICTVQVKIYYQAKVLENKIDMFEILIYLIYSAMVRIEIEK